MQSKLSTPQRHPSPDNLFLCGVSLNELNCQCLLTLYHPYICKECQTRVRGITRSVSSRRLEGDGFDARPKPRHS